jgi:DNA-binding response OmpR family regulator
MHSSMNILCVEDNIDLLNYISQALAKAGHTVEVSTDGQKGANKACGQFFDAVLLDLGLPGCDGLDVVRQIRQAGREPWICLLTARSDLRDRIAGLNAGADDYMTKPFSLDELLARLEALRRRRQQASSPEAEVLRVADVTMDFRNRRVSRRDQEIILSPREFALLQIFMQEPHRVFCRDEISERIWQREHTYDSRTVEIYVGRLRKKLNEGYPTRLLQTQRGEGYCFSQV